MFSWLFGKDTLQPIAEQLYRAIVDASRNPELYQKYGAPDTVDGRFDMVITHAILVFKRLRSEGEAGKDLSQKVFDVMFDDMDAALRELGTGDMTVGKKIREMGEAFYGRAAAYDTIIDSQDKVEFAKTLQRNLFAVDDHDEIDPDTVSQSATDLADYFLGVFQNLEDTDAAILFQGRLFP